MANQTAAEILDAFGVFSYPEHTCLDVVKALVDGLTSTVAPLPASLWPELNTLSLGDIYQEALRRHGDRGEAWVWGLDQIIGLSRYPIGTAVRAGDILVIDGMLQITAPQAGDPAITVDSRPLMGTAIYARTNTEFVSLVHNAGLLAVLPAGSSYTVVAHYRPENPSP